MSSRSRFAALVLAPLLALTLTGCGEQDGAQAGDDVSTTDSTPPSESPGESAGAASGGGSCNYADDGTTPSKEVEAPPAKPVVTKPTRATIATSAGDVTVTLDADKAPCTVSSFLSLAQQQYFDGTSCHRLTTQGIYVLQCGDPSGTGSGGPGYSFADELIEDDSRIQPCQEMQGQNVCTYGPGTLAMANAGADTNGSQFFLVYDSSPLPAAYTVFGRMDAAGLKVVKEVAEAGIGQAGMGPSDGSPKTPVEITGVTQG